MLRLANTQSPARQRKAKFSARLQTELPGIFFTARGSTWFRQDLSSHQAMPLRAARAAALAGIYQIAKAIAHKFEPGAVFHAEQAIAVSLADWRPLENSPVMVRAALTLDLADEDSAKAERFTESRRAARLEEALTRDRMDFLREVILTSEKSARLWWLHCNLAGDNPATSWEIFEGVVRPVIPVADENDPVTELAQALLTLNDHLHEDPDRLKSLAGIAAFAADKVGEDRLARTLAAFASSDSSEANRPNPASE